MPNPHLATYLNDHLAGSGAALELLRHLENEQAGTDLADFATQLRSEIEADRLALEGLMDRLEISRSVPRRAAAWLAEKMAVLKLRLDDPSGSGLRLLETLEALSLGIEGKRSLWRALEAASGTVPSLGSLDYPELIRRAEDQLRRVEALRLESAKGAFGEAGSG